MKTPLNRLPATRLARMIAAHEVSCEAVTHSFNDALRDREQDIRAFAWFDAARVAALRSSGAYVFGKTVTAELANFIRDETAKWAPIVRASGASAN